MHRISPPLPLLTRALSVNCFTKNTYSPDNSPDNNATCMHRDLEFFRKSIEHLRNCDKEAQFQVNLLNMSDRPTVFNGEYIEIKNPQNSFDIRKLFIPKVLYKIQLPPISQYKLIKYNKLKSFNEQLGTIAADIVNHITTADKLCICVEGPPVGHGKTSLSKKLLENFGRKFNNNDKAYVFNLDEKYKISREKRIRLDLQGADQYNFQCLIEDIVSKSIPINIIDGVFSGYKFNMDELKKRGYRIVRIGIQRGGENSFQKRFSDKRLEKEKLGLGYYQQIEMMLFVEPEAQYASDIVKSGTLDFVIVNECTDMYIKIKLATH